MNKLIGLRREDRDQWEQRVPLIPEDVKELKQKYSVEIRVQTSKTRIFSDEDYIRVDAQVQDDLSPCPIIFAIKEIPLELFERQKTYIFFSHTIKGQSHNMPILKKIMELKGQLIDYEKVTDEKGKRLVFFGEYAGLAGMIDTLWAFGQRLNSEGIQNPFSEIRQTLHYESLVKAKTAIAKVGKEIAVHGLPESLTPLICGIAGYGNVSLGAQEILDLLPVQEIAPAEIVSVIKKPNPSRKIIYKVVFKEEHLVEPIDPGDSFELQDYYNHPEKYRSRFHTYLPHLTILVNGIYWEKRYPRLVTKQYLRQSYANTPTPRLRVIGDITCDIEGSIECTVRATKPDNPIYVYDPFNDQTIDGPKGTGPVILAIDNLPCELSRESSTYFSGVLKHFIPDIVQADFSVDFARCKLPPTIKNAVIAYQGELTPNYRYLAKYL